jgi:hypothetical protein
MVQIASSTKPLLIDVLVGSGFRGFFCPLEIRISYLLFCNPVRYPPGLPLDKKA